MHNLQVIGSSIDLRAVRLLADWPDTLAEGEGLSHEVVVAGGPRELVVEGELWTSPIRLRLIPSGRQGRISAA